MYKKGQTVSILNQTMSGKFFVEGDATIIRSTGVEGQYVVKFVNSGPSRCDVPYGNCERFVDDCAQDDPHAYAKMLNARQASAA